MARFREYGDEPSGFINARNSILWPAG